MTNKVDLYLASAKNWQLEMTKLRAITLECQLSEDMKWGKLCYTFQGKNVALIIAFKHYCSLMFIKGALLEDTHNVLIKATNNTHACHQIRFTSLEDINNMQIIIKDYLNQAIEIERAGLKISFKSTKDFIIPSELQLALNNSPELKLAFNSLTPGRQRAYILHFSDAKKSTTRTSRINKCIAHILDGKGLND